MTQTPTAFLSYSWDSEDHKQWVRELSARLRNDGIETILDQWHAQPGDQLPHFMASSIQNNDFVLIICTPDYKEKSQRSAGGVRYEGDIINSDLFISQKQRKYIPILRRGKWSDAAPVSISGKNYIDLRENIDFEKNYQELVQTLNGTRPQPPPVKHTNIAETLKPPQEAASVKEIEWEDIKLVGIILEKVTSPRLDGTPGSVLYEIPFKLSRRPTLEWEDIFVHKWNHPSYRSSMHRPGIASIAGEKVILDGTTIEEVEQFHLTTLKLVIKETNQVMADWFQKQQLQKKIAQQQQQEHEEKLRNAAKRLNFDDE